MGFYLADQLYSVANNRLELSRIISPKVTDTFALLVMATCIHPTSNMYFGMYTSP